MPVVDVKKQIEAKNWLSNNCTNFPKNKEIPHWTALTDLAYADTWLWNTNIRFDINKNLKLQSNLENIQKNRYTGNFFKTKKGHLIYIGNAEAPDTMIALDKKMFGKNPIRYHISRLSFGKISGGGWAENFTENMFLKDKKAFGNWLSPNAEYRNPNTRREEERISYYNWYNLLEKIETSNIPTNDIIVITYDSKGISTHNIAKEINKFLTENQTYIIAGITAATSIFSLGLTAPQCIAMFAGIKTIASKLENYEEITVADISNATQPILPKTFYPYAKAGLDTAYALNDPSPENLIKAANNLGVEDSKIQNVLSSVTSPEKAGYLLTALKKSKKFDDANILLGVLQCQKMVDTTMLDAKTVDMAKNLIQKEGIKSGYLGTLFNTSNSNTLTGLIPNVSNLCSALTEEYKKIMTNEEYVATVNMGTSRNDLDKSLPNLSMQSLLFQAIKSADNNTPYILPPTVDEKYRKCTAMTITAETGIPVIEGSTYKSQTEKTGKTTLTTKTIVTSPKKTQKRKRREYL